MLWVHRGDEHMYQTTAFDGKPSVRMPTSFYSIWSSPADLILHKLAQPFTMHKISLKFHRVPTQFQKCNSLTVFSIIP